MKLEAQKTEGKGKGIKVERSRPLDNSRDEEIISELDSLRSSYNHKML